MASSVSELSVTEKIHELLPRRVLATQQLLIPLADPVTSSIRLSTVGIKLQPVEPTLKDCVLHPGLESRRCEFSW